MATDRDYYEILGIPRDATDEQIKKAFRKLAFQYHPDHNREGCAEDKFKEINEAYETLSDSARRASYDRFGRTGGSGFNGFEGFDFGGLGDIFDAFFGGSAGFTAQRQTPQKGADLRVSLKLSFEEAVFGADKEFEIWRVEKCSTCRGAGSEPGTSPQKCPNCHGSGQIRRAQQSLFGRFVHTVVCPHCSGEGTVITHPCRGCKGSGQEKIKRKLMVNIPPGIDEGYRVRLAGEGSAGTHGGPPGDIYIGISIAQHEVFVRRDNDILYELAINFTQAALGDQVEVPTLDGRATLKIPSGTQNGKVFRIKGKGVSHLGARGRGDQLVAVRVVTPKSLDENQRRLFAELGRTLPDAESHQGNGKESRERLESAIGEY